MQQWEYWQLEVVNDTGLAEDSYLADVGRAGWELVAYEALHHRHAAGEHVGLYVFKRPVGAPEPTGDA